ncbi:hypothetical protein STSO111631_20700 [Stackebrandtia soli]
MIATLRARLDAKLDQWLAQAHEEPEEWFRASTIGNWTLLLTASELATLNEDVKQLVAPYLARNRRNDPELPSDARRVAAQLRAHPLVDDGHAPEPD